jgi:hypothetical protein
MSRSEVCEFSLITLNETARTCFQLALKLIYESYLMAISFATSMRRDAAKHQFGPYPAAALRSQ